MKNMQSWKTACAPSYCIESSRAKMTNGMGMNSMVFTLAGFLLFLTGIVRIKCIFTTAEYVCALDYLTLRLILIP